MNINHKNKDNQVKHIYLKSQVFIIKRKFDEPTIQIEYNHSDRERDASRKVLVCLCGLHHRLFIAVAW